MTAPTLPDAQGATLAVCRELGATRGMLEDCERLLRRNAEVIGNAAGELAALRAENKSLRSRVQFLEQREQAALRGYAP